MGIQLDESARGPTADTPVSGEFRCAACGYGVVIHRRLPPCPMCGATVWESQEPLQPRPID
jgi:rubrerythrin